MTAARLPRTADAVVIGGGLVGCAVARALGRAGLQPVVLERGGIGAEASRAAAGMVAPQAESHGPGPLLAAGLASRRAYGRFVAAVAAESGVDVEYRRDGVLYLAFTPGERGRLLGRVRWQRAAGLRAERLSARAARRLVPLIPERVPVAVHFPDDHRVNNERLAVAIGIAARRAGARIVEEVGALAVDAARDRVRGVTSAKGRIATPIVVNAAGAWAPLVRLPRGCAPPPVVPVRGQMLVIRTAPGRLPMPVYSARGYVVPRRDGRVLAGSTYERVGFDKRVTVTAARRLFAVTCAITPGLAEASVEGSYAGLRPGTPDDLPIVGPAADLDGLVYATGMYRSGILLAPLVAAAVADLVLGGRTRRPVAGFDPARFGR